MLGAAVAVFSLLISAVALLLSYRASKRSQQTTTIQSGTQLTLEVDKVFIDNPGLRPYFYEGKAPPRGGSDKANQVLAVGEYILDALECIWRHNKDNGIRDEHDSWASYIRDVYANSPVLGDLFKELHTDKESKQAGSGWYPSLAELNLGESLG